MQQYECCLLKVAVQGRWKLLYWCSLYQEANEVAKEPLLEDDDSGSEVDSESEEDTPATFAFKPIVA